MMAQAKEGRTAGASWGVAPSAGGPGERLASDTDISPLVNPKLRPGRLGTALGKGATPGQASGPVHPETVSFSYNHIGEQGSGIRDQGSVGRSSCLTPDL